MADIRNILIVDNDEDDVELFTTVLMEVHPEIQVTNATTVTTAERLIDSMNKPDLIVMDLHLPIKPGKELLSIIRSKNDLKSTPVVLLSGYKNEAEIKFCLENGARKYYQKPTTYTGLKHVVSEIVSSAEANG